MKRSSTVATLFQSALLYLGFAACGFLLLFAGCRCIPCDTAIPALQASAAAIMPENRAYVEADPSKTEEQKTRRRKHVDEYLGLLNDLEALCDGE